MSRVSYVNGEYMDHEKAVVPIEDRGFQFADAVYEVAAFFNRKLLDFYPHFERLERSLSKLSIKNPLSQTTCRAIFEELIKKNEFNEGIIYLQITRGTAIRDHAFPDPPVAPNVVATAKGLDMPVIKKRVKSGVGIILVPENRWRQVDIKSTSLLGNVLAKEEAKKAGAYEAVFVDLEENLTEGTSSNVWMVDKNGILKTRKASGKILAGITRLSVKNGLGGGGVNFEETPFSVEEIKTAREVFLTSTTSLLMPVVHIKGEKVGNGEVGPITKALQNEYFKAIETQTGYRVLS